MVDNPTMSLASMGNYVFDVDVLVDTVTPTADATTPTDLGGDVIPALTASGDAWVYDFSQNQVPGQTEHERGYWRDVGSIDAYYDANMDLLDAAAGVQPLQQGLAGLQPQPPAAAGQARHRQRRRARAGARTACCAPGRSCRAASSRSRSSGRTRTSTPARRSSTRSCSRACASVPGPGCYRCVVDKNVVVPPGERIGHDPGSDAELFSVSAGGVVVVPKEHRTFRTL